jgi:transglutaminase-like putative cysteine protease
MKRKSTSDPGPPLPGPHLVWLAAAIGCAQLPLLTHLPAWVGITGFSLLALRIMLEHRRSPSLPAWTLLLACIAAGIAVRLQYGYLIGREPCVALLFLLVSMKLVEAKSSRDGTSLLCLSAFLTVTQFFYGQSVVSALAAMPAVLTITAAFIVIQHPAESPIWRDAFPRAARMLLQGIPLAFVFFLLFPRISGPLWGVPTDNSGRTGLSDTMEPGWIREVSLSDDVAFRVDFEGDPPPYGFRYWRGPVLSQLDGNVWRSAPVGPRNQPPLPAQGRHVAYTVILEPNNQRYFLALDLPSTTPDDAYVTPAFELKSRTAITRQVRYRQESVLMARHGAVGPGFFDKRLPQTRNPRTRAWSRELRERYPDDQAFTQAVMQNFAREKFVYSLQGTVLGDDTVDEFLFDTKTGFCEHFASAFVYVLRAAGIPARVVTGYLGGEMNTVGGLSYMIVRQSDAHAWAEAWIGGGWQRFDPTSMVAPARLERGLGAALREGEGVPFFARLEASWWRDLRLNLDAVNYGWQRWVVGYNNERQRALWSDAGLGDASVWKLILVLTGSVVAAAGLIALLVLYRRVRVDPVLAAWNKLGARLARAGLPRRPNEGPLAYCTRAAQRWPRHAATLDAAAHAYCVLRYGRVMRSEDDAWSALRRALSSLPRSRRLRREAAHS